MDNWNVICKTYAFFLHRHTTFIRQVCFSRFDYAAASGLSDRHLLAFYNLLILKGVSSVIFPARIR